MAAKLMSSRAPPAVADVESSHPIAHGSQLLLFISDSKARWSSRLKGALMGWHVEHTWNSLVVPAGVPALHASVRSSGLREGEAVRWCVQLKSFSERMAERCRKAGAHNLYDRIDGFLYLRQRQRYQRIDYWLENSVRSANFLRGAEATQAGFEKVKSPTAVLAHPHSVEPETTAARLRDVNSLQAPRNLLLVGDATHLPTAHERQALRSAASGAGLVLTTFGELFSASSGSLGPSAANMTVDDIRRAQAAHHALYARVDMCLIWPPPKPTPFELLLRPVTRLVTCLAHGLPTVFHASYENYLEVVREQPLLEAHTIATSDRHAAQLLRRLTSDRQLRERVSRDSLLLAERYSMRTLSRRYAALLLAASGRSSPAALNCSASRSRGGGLVVIHGSC